ncbi:cyclase family protein [Paenibacillus sp. ISL-20]|uniref:cyclase family protein n=1 Tax=Paenibacillus sp. ISL-20 TaxID=2819163 RepID=UPI001BEB9361|nr:cyclase family protein [Paenibacillus sp. ISL-20]MBT2764362.1 cyclase family protein [Paenibacillus sp. ISL-20]
MKLIDLTHMIQSQLTVYPGDSEMELIQTKNLMTDGYCNHQLTINMHTGTHIDGPMHLIDSDQYLCDFPLESFIGRGTLLNVSGMNRIDYKDEYEHLINEGTILILYTGHSIYFRQEKYFTEYPTLTKEFAELVVRKKIKMIGLDTPSPDKFPFEIHKYLFDNQVLIAENLVNVDQLLNLKSFEIIALPLLIKTDSAIARIVARTD